MKKEQKPWSPAEWWLLGRLRASRKKWTRSDRSRFLQFECGMAVDLVPLYGVRAEFNEREVFFRSGLIMMAVREFDDGDIAEVLHALRFVEPWDRRRRALGLPGLRGRHTWCERPS
jgi:hypothetical protein